jgi:putative nucleotide binding protein
MQKEEKCIILDFLSTGYADRRHSEPIAQAMGYDFFSLLEIVPREGVTLQDEEVAYIGNEKRDKIKFIRGTLAFKDLTNMARNLLPVVIEKIVRENEAKFVNFFNKSHMITPRMHQIQLLPGIGKKHLVDILESRSKKPFESFNDIVSRVKFFPDPVKVIVRRVMNELEEDQKYYLFTQPKRKF